MTPAVDLRAAFSIHQHEAVSPWIYDEKRNEFMKTATADDVNQLRKQSRKLTGNEDEEDILKSEQGRIGGENDRVLRDYAASKNAAGLVPFALASNLRHAVMKEFLIDAMMFNKFPYHTPTVISFCLVVSSYIMFLNWNIFLVAFISYILLFFTKKFAIQWTIEAHRSRCYAGCIYGFLTILYLHHLLFTAYGLSFLVNLVIFALHLVVSLLSVKLYTTKPKNLQPTDHGVLARAIVDSSPKEGHYEYVSIGSGSYPQNDGISVDDFIAIKQPENAVYGRHGNGREELVTQLIGLDGEEAQQREYIYPVKTPVFDAVTENGTDIHIKNPTSPIICGECIADKRFAMAHCKLCGKCIVGYCGHAKTVGICIGEGNRRLFCGTLLTGSFYILLLCLCAYLTHSKDDEYCGSNIISTNHWSGIYHLLVEWCMLTSHFRAFLPNFLGFVSALSLISLVFFEVHLVARETTYDLLHQNMYEFYRSDTGRPRNDRGGEGSADLENGELVHSSAALTRNFIEFCKYGTYRIRYRDVYIEHAGGGVCKPWNVDYLKANFIAPTMGRAAAKGEEITRNYQGKKPSPSKSNSDASSITRRLNDYLDDAGPAEIESDEGDDDADLLLGGPAWWSGHDNVANLVRLHQLSRLVLNRHNKPLRFEPRCKPQPQVQSNGHHHGPRAHTGSSVQSFEPTSSQGIGDRV